MALNARPDPAVFGGDEASAARWARQVERRFEVWARSPYACDLAMRQNLGQMCAQAVKWWFGLGEITGLIRYKMRPGNSHGTKIQVIPPQRIPQAAKKQPSVQGVVLDADGAPVTYCIDNFDPNNPGVVEEKEVRARDRYGRLVVIHVHDSPPTVVRGISPMAPAIQVVRQYDQLANATLTAALIQAIFAATIELDAPTEQLLSALQDEDEQATPTNGGGQAGEARRLQPVHGGAGAMVQPHQVRPRQGRQDHAHLPRRKAQLSALGASERRTTSRSPNRCCRRSPAVSASPMSN